MANMTVHAGDFKEGKHHDFIFSMFQMKGDGWLPEAIPMSDVNDLELANEESVKRLGGTIGWAVLGSVLLGPVGLLAGLLAGGRGKDVTFVCVLKDGRRFMASTSSKVYTKILASRF